MLFFNPNRIKSYLLIIFLLLCNLNLFKSQNLFESNTANQDKASLKNEMSQTNSINNQSAEEYTKLYKQIEEKKNIISGLINSYSVNNPNSNPTANSNDITNNISNSNRFNTPTEIEKKINQLSQIVESVSLENQRLKPMLKSVADMQYFTFKKLKSYEASLGELKLRMSNSGMREISSPTSNEQVNPTPNVYKNTNLNSQMSFRFVEP